MKIGVTGAEGYLGKAFVNAGCVPILGNVTVNDEISDAIKSANVDAVIHCAAMTSVEECERDFTAAFNANTLGTSNVVAAMESNQILFYMSTDHVFPGKAHPFNFNGYTETHSPSPVNVYGYTKWGGELVSRYGLCQTLVIRSSKIFSYETLKPGIDFLRGGREYTYSKVICRSFLHRTHFVDTLLDVATRCVVDKSIDKFGEVLHIAGSTLLSYYQFWMIIADIFGLDEDNIKSRDYALKDATPRPLVGGLSVGRLKSIGFKVYHPVDGIYKAKEESNV